MIGSFCSSKIYITTGRSDKCRWNGQAPLGPGFLGVMWGARAKGFDCSQCFHFDWGCDSGAQSCLMRKMTSSLNKLIARLLAEAQQTAWAGLLTWTVSVGQASCCIDSWWSFAPDKVCKMKSCYRLPPVLMEPLDHCWGKWIPTITKVRFEEWHWWPSVCLPGLVCILR